MKPMIKPDRLRRGDKVAVVSPSWGGPGTFPHRYEIGKRQLQDAFGVEVVEMPHTLASPEFVAANPKARADDLMAAFNDPSIKGIIASIGGDDSVRLLPYMDIDIIKNNPKIFMGYSDPTVLHFACYKASVTSFYGPAIMAGFAENGGIHDYTRASVAATLFNAQVQGQITPASEWTVELLRWEDPANQSRKRAMRPNAGPRVINGTGTARGHLIGGCVEVLEMIKGSSVWPSLDEWRGAILFLETSEEAPSTDYFKRIMRHYGTLGILQVLSGIILGRPGGKLPDDKLDQYDRVIHDVVHSELGLTNLPILGQLDFGHTDPMFVIPYGAQAEIDCSNANFSILECGVK